jgi:hypothetical protein
LRALGVDAKHEIAAAPFAVEPVGGVGEDRRQSRRAEAGKERENLEDSSQLHFGVAAGLVTLPTSSAHS